MSGMRMLDDRDIEMYVALCDTSPTGLVWLALPNSRTLGEVGGPALCRVNNKGYYYGLIKRRTLLAHRVVFYLTEGYWPEQVDHIDGVRSNNKPGNLRAITCLENHHNRIARGTVYHKGKAKWQARIRHSGRQHSLGYFPTEEEAHAAYLLAKAAHHPTAPERCYAS